MVWPVSNLSSCSLTSTRAPLQATRVCTVHCIGYDSVTWLILLLIVQLISEYWMATICIFVASAGQLRASGNCNFALLHDYEFQNIRRTRRSRRRKNWNRNAVVAFLREHFSLSKSWSRWRRAAQNGCVFLEWNAKHGNSIAEIRVSMQKQFFSIVFESVHM